MAAVKIANKVYWVGSLDWNHRLFDELIPLPEGTSYNSYLIKGKDKVALIDTDEPRLLHELLHNLNSLGIKNLDYIIANHAEQDHSGSIPKLLEIYPEAMVVTNNRCKCFLMDLLLIPEERFITIEDRQTLSLGDITLEFIFFPWVHWPETMFTYAMEPKILFSCDLFGSHVADSRIVLSKEREDDVKIWSFRYFAEIMYPFRDNIANNFNKVLDLDLKMIAPSHGPVYDNPKYILDCYKDWISGQVHNKVVIPYISMHGSTEIMVNYLTDALMHRGIEVKPLKLSVVDLGDLAMAIANAATVVIGACAVLNGMHPTAAYAIYFYNLMRPKTKFISIVGSFGWGTKMVDQVQSMLYNVKAEFLPPVVAKGLPKEPDLKSLDQLADQILQKHKDLDLL